MGQRIPTGPRDAMPYNTLSRLWSLVLDIAYPPRCGGCDRRGTLFCEECLATVRPSTEQAPPEGIGAMVFGGLFAGPLREAIHKLKYEGDTPLAGQLASFVYRAMAPLYAWEAADGTYPSILAVPLHAKRQRARGFNQSELLVRELSRLSGWPAIHGLVRVRETRSQVGLHANERQENMRGAFAWMRPVAPPACVLLLDDVCTTGATLAECASVLRTAGAEEVYAAAAGRAHAHGPDAGK